MKLGLPIVDFVFFDLKIFCYFVFLIFDFFNVCYHFGFVFVGFALEVLDQGILSIEFRFELSLLLLQIQKLLFQI